MLGEFPILPMAPRTAPTISALVLDVFERFIGPDYSDEGRESFERYASVDAVRFRLESGEVSFGAFDRAELVGVLEMRGHGHIALLFVKAGHQRRGIARALVERAVRYAKEGDPSLTKLTVNASPYALAAYEHLGFVATSDEHDQHGVRSTPMEKPLE